MKSIRDIYKIGKGPSSSHTIGPERAAKFFKEQHPDAEAFQVDLFGSLSKTGKGHGTDRVLREVLSPLPTEIVFRTDSPEDVRHPNTMDFSAMKEGKVFDTLRVESVGGGDIRFAGHKGNDLPEVYPENSFAEVEQFPLPRSGSGGICGDQRGGGHLGIPRRDLGDHEKLRQRGSGRRGYAARRSACGQKG